uniref:Methyltransferase type 11 domain-containing protein n=1 Tax=Trypanosoma congolense (strain IL3000) TaxID=1068625 RepID=G0UYS6_TRYCI|nr:conserved hypothetical protein [Trypanosoma congolense IL3000]
MRGTASPGNPSENSAGANVEEIFAAVRPILEGAGLSSWSNSNVTVFLSLLREFCESQRRRRPHHAKERQFHQCEKEDAGDEGRGCDSENNDSGGSCDDDDSLVRMEMGRSLTKLRRYLKQCIPYGAVREPTTPHALAVSGDENNSTRGESTTGMQLETPVTQPVYAVDAFLYLEEDIDTLKKQGHISRDYCRTCGSVDIGLCQFITHSFSQDQLIFISCYLLRALGDTSYCLARDGLLQPRDPTQTCSEMPPISCRSIVDVGSRLGVVPLACYFASKQRCLPTTRQVTGIEVDDKFIAIQQEAFRLFAASPATLTLNLIHSNCFEGKGTEALRCADVLVLHNIFEYFTASAEEHLRSWKRLRELVARRGQLLICRPSLQETFGNFSEETVRTVFAGAAPSENGTPCKRRRTESPAGTVTLTEWWQSWVMEVDVRYVRELFLEQQRSLDGDDDHDSHSSEWQDELVEELEELRVYVVL